MEFTGNDVKRITGLEGPSSSNEKAMIGYQWRLSASPLLRFKFHKIRPSFPP
jgi:hypothetical protein